MADDPSKNGKPETEAGEPPKRLHRATYARDKKKGGYLIRISGPTAGRFAGREVPVTRADGSESMEMLDGLIWTGIDDGTTGGQAGAPVALYSFKQRERKQDDALPF